MLKHYITIAFRRFLKEKHLTFMHLLGLSLGLTATLLLTAYILFERSYDPYAKDRSIYRITFEFQDNGELSERFATSAHATGPALKEEVPGIKNYARLERYDNVVYKEELAFNEEKMYFADPTAIEMLGLNIVKGESKKGLSQPNTLVISEEYAQKYFGQENPIGQTLKLSDQFSNKDFTVTGVFKDLPPNRHIHFNILISWATRVNWWPDIETFWNAHVVFTYLELEPHTAPYDIEAAYPAFIEKYKNPEKVNLTNMDWRIRLIPVQGIHLHSLPHTMWEPEPQGDHKALLWLGAVGVIILLITWFNYINLTLARTLLQAGEIGLRKVLGSQRSQLLHLYLTEALLLHIMAAILSFGILSWAMPLMGQLMHKPLASFALLSPSFYLITIIILVFGSLIAGLLPLGLIPLSKPAQILKNKFSNSKTGLHIRKGIVIFQVSLTLILIAITYTFYQQVQFMRNRSKGVDLSQTMVVHTPTFIPERETKMDLFKREVTRLPGVQRATLSGQVPGKEVRTQLGINRYGQSRQEEKHTHMIKVNPDFLDFFHIPLLGGRFFSPDFPSDSTAIVINTTTAKLIGFSQPDKAIGQQVRLEGSNQPFQIIGVVKDYNQYTLKKGYIPMIFTLFHFWDYGHRYFSIRLDNQPKTVEKVQTLWHQIFGNQLFENFFLEQHFDQQYRQDIQFSWLFNFFAILAIILASLGISGMMFFLAQLKTKEIGVRKIMGATDHSLIGLVFKDYFQLLFWAYIISLPPAIWGIQKWLMGFAFHISLPCGIFVFPICILVLFSFLLVSQLVFRTTRKNPAEVLHDE